MYVSHQYRGQGINAKIIEKLMSWSKRKGVYDLYLDIYSQNVTAVKAYDKVGFKPSLMEMKLSVK